MLGVCGTNPVLPSGLALSVTIRMSDFYLMEVRQANVMTGDEHLKRSFGSPFMMMQALRA